MSEEFENAVFVHLGVKALPGKTMSLHEAFKNGWQAAREIDAKRIAELESELAACRDLFEDDNSGYWLDAVGDPLAVYDFVSERVKSIASEQNELEAQNKAMLEALHRLGQTKPFIVPSRKPSAEETARIEFARQALAKVKG